MKKITDILKNNGVAILPTDTIYGLVGSALNKETVQRIYKIRKRNLKKPMIILIGSLADLKLFNLKISRGTKKILREIWPGKVSVILGCKSKEFFYLHRGTKKLAFRLPAKKSLIKLLKKTGPLVAPSANFEGLPPAKTIKEARKYFGDKVDFYIDGGKVNSAPSTLLAFKNKKLILVRKGVGKFKSIL